jgi:hypothetical protein
VNPSVQDGKKLIPGVTRVFSKGREFYVHLQAYEQGTAPAKPLVAFVSFYQGQTKMFETQPIAGDFRSKYRYECGASEL